MSSVDSVAARVVGKVDLAIRERIARDPFAAARNDFHCAVIELENPNERGEGGSCDGFSFLDANTIYYRSTFSDRQNFTVAHELAHQLVENDDDAVDWLTSQAGAPKLEAVCEAVAALLLIPDDTLVAIGSPPTAEGLAAVFKSTKASRSACAVRIAQRLPCDGFVAIINAPSQHVFFAARHEDTRPYAWQGNPVPDAHHVRFVEDGKERQVESWWPFPNGDRARFYMSAYRERDWIFAIFAVNDLWHTTAFHAPEQRQLDTRPELTHHCPDCGYDGAFRGYPCADCRTPYCPKCTRCACDRRNERSSLCKSCGYVKAKHLLDEKNICVDCRS
jgi:Zn-dependent peptidase ImmA (M78 family)